MMNSSRRRFLHSMAGTGLALTAGFAPAIDPIRRRGKAHLRLSLAGYSFHRLLNLDAKPKPAMTLDDFADFAARIGLKAIEPTSYYFPETTPEYLDRFKARCTRLGLTISGTAVANNFCSTDPAKLRKDIAHVKQWVDHAARLGAPTIRIFAGSVDRGDTEDKARTRCVETIQEACDYAGKREIYLALENHGGITGNAEQTLAIVKAVKHAWFGVNLDTGNFHTADPYADLEKLVPYAVTVQLKTEIRRAGSKKAEEADLPRLIRMLREGGYRGFVALEYEAAEDPRTAVPHYVKELEKLIG